MPISISDYLAAFSRTQTAARSVDNAVELIGRHLKIIQGLAHTDKLGELMRVVNTAEAAIREVSPMQSMPVQSHLMVLVDALRPVKRLVAQLMADVEAEEEDSLTLAFTEVDDLSVFLPKAASVVVPQEAQLYARKLGKPNAEVKAAFQLMVWLLERSNLKWDDLKGRPPFVGMGWKVIRLYEHYAATINPMVEHEDNGLNDYYTSSYLYMNPFLRYMDSTHSARYEEIMDDRATQAEQQAIITELTRIKQDAGFSGECDWHDVMRLFARLKGAARDIIKNSQLRPLDLPYVYRGDGSRTAQRVLRACGLTLASLAATGEVDVQQMYTQVGFTSTTDSQHIGPPASDGTIWNIKLGKGCVATDGGVYTGESEILFPPGTNFFIEKVMTAANYDNSLVKLGGSTQYVIFARQGV